LGKPTPENEWEFRAFFDKIIQLPFTMPMGNYDIANYVLGPAWRDWLFMLVKKN
jgi:hypothetical protein